MDNKSFCELAYNYLGRYPLCDDLIIHIHESTGLVERLSVEVLWQLRHMFSGTTAVVAGSNYYKNFIPSTTPTIDMY
jgi:hypothetical protein